MNDLFISWEGYRLMTTNQLKYFITAAECLNFTEAAKQHFISQTAITQHMQALEEDLEVKLFDRQKRKVSLTPAGHVFLTEARMILERNQAAIMRTRKAAEGISGNLNIGYVKGQENTRFGNLLKDFSLSNPSIAFYIYREAHLDLLLDLDEDRLDAAVNICYKTTNIEGFKSLHVATQKLFAVLPATHPYAQLSAITRYDLRNEKFLLTKFYDNPRSKKFDHIIPQQFAESGFIPKVVGKSTDIETLMLLVAAGIGITIAPESAIKYVRQSSDLVFIPLIGEHEHVDIMVIWKESNQNPALPIFIDVLRKDAIERGVIQG